jgi:hypothetical protein
MARRELEHKKQIDDLHNQLHASRSEASRPDQADEFSVGVAMQALQPRQPADQLGPLIKDSKIDTVTGTAFNLK